MSQNQAVKPQSEKAIANMFDKISSKYDFLNRMLSAGQDQRWRRHMLAMVPYRVKGALLDVATGTGDVVINFAEKRSDYETLVGVDISNQMLELARQKEQARPVKHPVRFANMSAERLDFDPSTFDCLTISFGLRNVVDKDNALKEFHRVLKEDGILLILEFFPPKTGIISKLFLHYFHRVLPFIGGLFSDRSAYTYLPQSVLGFGSIDDLRKQLASNGFVFEQQMPFIFGACRLIRARKISSEKIKSS